MVNGLNLTRYFAESIFVFVDIYMLSILVHKHHFITHIHNVNGPQVQLLQHQLIHLHIHMQIAHKMQLISSTGVFVCISLCIIRIYVFSRQLIFLCQYCMYRFNRVSCHSNNDRCQTLSYLTGCFAFPWPHRDSHVCVCVLWPFLQTQRLLIRKNVLMIWCHFFATVLKPLIQIKDDAKQQTIFNITQTTIHPVSVFFFYFGS